MNVSGKKDYCVMLSARQVGFAAVQMSPMHKNTPITEVADFFIKNPQTCAVPIQDGDKVVGIVKHSSLRKKAVFDPDKTAADYMVLANYKVYINDFLEQIEQKCMDISRETGVFHFLVFNLLHIAGQSKEEFYGLISLDAVLSRIAEIHNQDMDKAFAVQQNLLPKPADYQKAPFSLSVWNKMVSKIGGDFYVCQAVTDDLYVAGCFDVSGKNISAALLTIAIGSFFTTMKYFLKTDTPPEKILSLLDTYLQTIIPLGSFITSVMCFIDKSEQTALLQNCGHTPTYIFTAKADESAEPDIQIVEPSLPPLGLGVVEEHLKAASQSRIDSFRSSGNILAALESASKKPAVSASSLIKYKSGMHINLYSDGLTDIQNENGERYENENAQIFFTELYKTKTSDFTGFVQQKLSSWMQNILPPDDITIMDIRF